MSEQDDINQYQQAQMAGALSGGSSGAAAQDAPAQGALNRQAASYSAGANSAIDSEGNPGEYSPQDQRTLLLLDNIRGQMAPKHTGATLLEGYGQAADNQYKTLSGIMSANAKARAAMALQGMKNQGSLGVAQTGAGAKISAAQIAALGHTWQDLTPEDLQARGYPPGTTGQINGRHEIRVTTRPPANQMGLTDDEQGNPHYMRPGTAPTASARTTNQSYLTAADPVLQQLDDKDPNSLYNRLNNSQYASESLGGPGMLERGAQSVAGLFGSTVQPAPDDAKLRADIADFNLKAGPLLRSGPGTEKMSDKQLDDMEHENLVDPTNHAESYASAKAKMSALKEHILSNVKSSQNTLQGNINYSGRQAQSAVTSPDELLAHAQDAIARGAPRDAVAAKLKQMGVDPSGLK